jgi:dienelactone hydrolase
MHVVRARRLVAVLFVLAAMAGALFVARPYVHGLSFVIRAADMQGAARRAADLDTRPIAERDISIPTRRGPMRGRLYVPTGAHGRAALLTSGLHPAGIDEPRLVALARHLSASGLAIVTPDIPELSQFEITPAITDAIEDSGTWLSTASGLSDDGKAGLMGISFSGGLSAIAAGRPSLADHAAFVFAFGGHDDLPRVLRYLCTGVEPRPGGTQLRLRTNAASGVVMTGAASSAATDNAFVRAPHDYGVAVMLLGSAERLVPAAQAEPLRAGIRRFLWASHLDRVDKPQADREFAALVDAAKRMPEPSRTLLRYVNERDVVHLGNRLLPYVAQYGGDPALSVSKSPKPKAPIFLLHGLDDNVIPPIESEYFAEDVRGLAPVRLLLSGLISHAEVDRPPHVGEVLQLAGFWGDLLGR